MMTDIRIDMDALRAVAVPPEQLATFNTPRGVLGGCVACKRAGIGHFDEHGKWLGCTHVPEGTIFVLVPVLPQTDTPPAPANGSTNTTKRSANRRLVYMVKNMSAVPKKGLTPRRQKVLKAIQSSGGRALTREILSKTRLPNNSVQEALSWLRGHGVIESQEDTTIP